MLQLFINTKILRLVLMSEVNFEISMLVLVLVDIEEFCIIIDLLCSFSSRLKVC
jgi:hypothetical protein